MRVVWNSRAFTSICAMGRQTAPNSMVEGPRHGPTRRWRGDSRQPEPGNCLGVGRLSALVHDPTQNFLVGESYGNIGFRDPNENPDMRRCQLGTFSIHALTRVKELRAIRTKVQAGAGRVGMLLNFQPPLCLTSQPNVWVGGNKRNLGTTKRDCRCSALTSERVT